MSLKHHTLALLLPVLVLVSCSRGGSVRRETTIGSETLNVMMPSGKEVVHPVYGAETWFGLGAMKGNAPAKANGVAQSHVFEKGTTVVTVNLNITEAPKGSRYVGWLHKPGEAERVRLDVLLNPLNDARHVITVDVPKDLEGYTEVVVTQERASGPEDTDPVVAVGTMKVQERP